MRLHEIRFIDRPIEDVFAYTSDFSNSEHWDPGVESSEQVDGAEPAVGAKYELMVTFGSRRIPMVYETIALESGSRVVLEGRGGSIRALDDIRFEAKDGSTIVDYTADLTFTNWMRYLTPILAPMLNKVGVNALDGLKETLER